MGLTGSARLALLVACALVAPACTSTGSPPAGSSECIDDVLAGYRALATPVREVAAAYGSVVRETAKLPFSAPVRGIRITVGEVFDRSPGDVPSKLQRIFRGVRTAFVDVRDATHAYARAARDAARVAADCAKDDSGCRDPLEGLASVLRDAGESMEASAADLRAALRRRGAGIERIGVAFERQGIALEQQGARLEGAAAAVAACV